MTGYRCPKNGSGTGSGKVFLHRPSRAQGPEGEVEEIELSGRGKVYSHTTLHAAAEPFEKDLPFQMAIIELEEGPRLTVRIEGVPVAIGDSVQVAREADGVWFFTK